MKSNIRILAVVALLVSFAACKKNIDSNVIAPTNPPGSDTSTHTSNPPTDTTVVVAYPEHKSTQCPNAPNYGDSILYLQPSLFDVIAKPINNPDSGTYFAWPKGLIIDKNTGAINVTKSEGGLRYSIGYVKKGTTDTCMQTLIMGGISYRDSLYILNNDERYATPFFNANPNLGNICDPSNGPGGNTCAFDLTGSLLLQGVVVHPKTGVIDLKNTAAKAFGLLPQNGTTVTTTMYYQLNDKSNLAPQHITLTFIYYNKKSDVPADLLALLADKLNKTLSLLPLVNLPSSNSTADAKSGSPRPPIVVVTKSAQ